MDYDEIRCPSRLHGRIVNGQFEVKCASKKCKGAQSGVVVLHYFNLLTGELENTKKFRDPARDFATITKERETQCL